MSERLKMFVNRSISDVEIEPDFGGFETGTEAWELLLDDLTVTKGLPNPL